MLFFIGEKIFLCRRSVGEILFPWCLGKQSIATNLSNRKKKWWRKKKQILSKGRSLGLPYKAVFKVEPRGSYVYYYSRIEKVAAFVYDGNRKAIALSIKIQNIIIFIHISPYPTWWFLNRPNQRLSVSHTLTKRFISIPVL